MKRSEEIEGNKDNRLRFAVMCNANGLKKWQVKTINLLLELDFVECVLLIVNDEGHDEKKGFVQKLFKKFNKGGAYHLYERYFIKSEIESVSSLPEELEKLPVLKCRVERKGKYSEYFALSDVEEIRSYKTDFILRFGFGILRGDLLNVSTYGVWSYHHGDLNKYRGGPPGFWELYRNDNVSGLVLQRLTDKLDAGIVLQKGFLPTIKHSYKENRSTLLERGISFPKRVCVDINNSTADYLNAEPANTKAPIYTFPRIHSLKIFVFYQILIRIKFHLQELFLVEQWNVGVVKKDLFECFEGVEESDIDWMPSLPNSMYRADSFAYMHNEKLNIIYEKFDYRNRKGIIASMQYDDDNGFENEKEAIVKPYHLSYPFILNHNNETYCIPETFENNRIDIYLFNKEKASFEFSKTLIDNIDAIDPTVFYYDDCWWVFCTKKQNGSNVNLYAYYSDKLDGEYHPHQANPIKTNISSSRPAGAPFVYNGSLYRPAQDCSKTYGGGVVMNRVLELTKKQFLEIEDVRISPFKKGKYRKGIHTFFYLNPYSIVDSKRMVFSFSNLFYQLKRRFCSVLS